MFDEMPTRDTSFELHRPEAGAATSDVRAGVLDVMLGHLQLTAGAAVFVLFMWYFLSKLVIYI